MNATDDGAHADMLAEADRLERLADPLPARGYRRRLSLDGNALPAARRQRRGLLLALNMAWP
jgi:hypothetical protein